ncbi:MAG: hypothetical protein J6N51_05800 [Selenomonas sp.]|nr:hypothetical protein [Selenomonas sp.]
MSRNSKKINKKQATRSQAEKKTWAGALRERMKQQVEGEKYAEALATLVELVEGKSYEADDFYLAAYCYFMVGDYERAARWVDNTLGMAPGHVAAQMLLSRLCILEDQTEKALAVLDNMLSISRSRLTQEQQEELTDILEYYGREDPEHIEKDYPAIAAFLKAELTEMVMGGAALVQPAPSQPETSASFMPETAPAEQSGGSALAALQKLKSRLQSSLPEQEQAGPPAQHKAPEQVVPKVAETKQVQPAPAQRSAEIREKLEEIAGKPVGLAAKVRLYNTFAGAYFFKRDYASAQAFLEAAAGIDSQDAETLRNLAMLAHEQGQTDQALAYASKLPQTDFLLLAALR